MDDVHATPPPSADEVRRIAVKLASLAKAGLTYGEISYDLDRYRQITELSTQLLAAVSDRTADELLLELGRDVGYATPKVDVRGVLFDADERVLLMRERIDERWSVPGGWADPGDAPSVAAVREVREETGYPAEAIKLIGCWDRDVQGHLPRMHVNIYKLFFLCRQTGEPTAPDALETLDVGWFGLDELPPLSSGRVNERQLRRALAHHRDLSLPTEFD
jgi:ADP-ribose pyrophosphatase YjhB (NUDIX family)